MVHEPNATDERSACDVVVVKTDASLSGLSAANFVIGGEASPLAIAYVSPHVDFASVSAALARLGGRTPVVAVATAGELCGGDGPLYLPDGGDGGVVVQIFPADLLAEVSIHSVPLPNSDICRGETLFDQDGRIEHMTEALMIEAPSFPIDVRDTVALAFVDGLSNCENYFMEAVYRCEMFPCMFVGGSTGGRHGVPRLFDSRQGLRGHAVCVFLKLRPGRGYGVFKTQNFEPTTDTFVVVDAEPDRRIVRTVLDPSRGTVEPFLDVLARKTGVAPRDVPERLRKNTFGIEIENELFVRSLESVDVATGSVSFYCDVNSGDRLVLLTATDIVAQTRQDVAAYLRGKPPALGAVLNDCLLRRAHNAEQLADLDGLWPMSVAGFSTFGELFGINVNETLSALVFFDTRAHALHDRLIETFPIHYARFCNYFTRTRLNRLQLLVDLHLQERPPAVVAKTG